MFKRINFQSIPVTDQQRALEFYRDKMGLTVQTDAPYGENFRWIFMQIPGAETLLQLNHVDEMVEKDDPSLCLVTDDVDAEAERLKELGWEFSTEPTDAPWHPAVRYALLRDSEGNLVLIQSSTLEGD